MDPSNYLKYGNFLNWTGFIQKCNEQENENFNNMLNTLISLEQRITELDSQKDELHESMKNFEKKVLTEIETYRLAIDNEIEKRIFTQGQQVLNIINNQMFEFTEQLQKHKEVLASWEDTDDLVISRPIQISHSCSVNSLRHEKKKPKLICYFNVYAMTYQDDIK